MDLDEREIRWLRAVCERSEVSDGNHRELIPPLPFMDGVSDAENEVWMPVVLRCEALRFITVRRGAVRILQFSKSGA